MFIQNNNENLRSKVTTLNTATAMESLIPDPVGKYLYIIQDSGENRECRVRANNRAEAWSKIRKYKHNGQYINTTRCTISGGNIAPEDAPEFFITLME